jgi:hypothetical protein
MTRRRRISNGAARALALAGAVGLSVAGSGSAAVLQDPAGDSGAAPDVTSVTVTNDARGRITFRLALANRPGGLEASDAAHDLVYVFLNTDRNASTGDVDGDDYLLQLAGDGFGVARWGGSGYTVLAIPSARATRNGGTVALTIASEHLDGTRGFRLSVVSVRIAGAALQSGETAPDTGRWTYALTRYCVAPKVTGRTLAAAKRAIRAADCAVGNVTQRAATATRGRVIAQSPKAGATRPRGARVHLVVSRGRNR